MGPLQGMGGGGGVLLGRNWLEKRLRCTAQNWKWKHIFKPKL